MRNQCPGQRKSLTVQLNLKPVMRIALYTKVYAVKQTGISPNDQGSTGIFNHAICSRIAQYSDICLVA